MPSDRYSIALERWLAIGATDFDARIGTVWHALGLADRLLGQPTSSLSGGEAARASLAALQLSRFDVYLLDEPTNDLDLDGLELLEAWVLEQRAGMILVSHDRRFLDRVVTHVVELDEFTHRTAEYAGGWQAYVEERALARQHAWERFDDYDTKRKALAGRAQRQREWASQGLARVKRSVDSEPDKNIRAFRKNQTEELAGKAAQTERAIERLEVADKPREPWQLRLEVADVGRSGQIVARLSHAVVERDGFRLGPIDLLLEYGERVAIVGHNGSGKSTLIDLILGRREPVSGTATLGASVRIGEVEQARHQLRRRRRGAAGGAGRDRSDGVGGADPARQVRPRRRSRATAGRFAVSRREDAGRAGVVDGQRRQPARARRTDEPPRPAGHRAARAGARHVRRHAPARHPRP